MRKPGLTIRPATEADRPEISRLLARSYGQLYRGWYPDAVLRHALPVMTRANPDLIASGTFHAAFVDGALAGCGGWSRKRYDGSGEEGVAHLRHFGVDPDHLRRGIGRALFERCRAEAAAAGFTALESLSSLPAEAFYLSLGFLTVGPARIELPDATHFAGRLMRAAIG